MDVTITLPIAGRDVTLTLDEARDLKRTLDAVLPSPVVPVTVGPYSPAPTFPNLWWVSPLIWTGNTTGTTMITTGSGTTAVTAGRCGQNVDVISDNVSCR